MNFINLTPHTLNIATVTEEKMYMEDYGNIGDIVATFGRYKFLNIEPSGTVARVEQNREYVGLMAGTIPVYNTTTGNVTGLPDPEPGTVYIVSSMVQSVVSGRDDVYSPGELIRDVDGRPVGCMGLDAPSIESDWQQKFNDLVEAVNKSGDAGYIFNDYIETYNRYESDIYGE